MLTIKYQDEFERTVLKVLPYFIFSVSKDRDILAEKCKSLFDLLSNNDTKKDFAKLNEEINILIDSGSMNRAHNRIQLGDYGRIDSMYSTRFEQIEADIKSLQNKVPYKRIKKIEVRLDVLENIDSEKKSVETPLRKKKISIQEKILKVDFTKTTAVEIANLSGITYEQVGRALFSLIQKGKVIKDNTTNRKRPVLYSKV